MVVSVIPVALYCKKNHLYGTSTGPVVQRIKCPIVDLKGDGSNLTGVNSEKI